MSEFSEKCKYYLLESGSNVYQLSQTFKLDRTTLQRMTTGKRLPGIDFVIKFCKCVRMNTLQTNELIELYKIDKLGKTVYNNRKCIARILQYLHGGEAGSPLNRIDIDITQVAEIYQKLELCFHSAEMSTVYTNLPANCVSFFHMLHRLHDKYNKVIPVTHLFPMQSNPSTADNVNANLEILYSILPIVHSAYSNYQFFYYYSRISFSDCYMALYPYYVITTSSVILLSESLDSSVLISDINQVCLYRMHFEQAIKLCNPLISRINNSFATTPDYLSLYIKNEIAWYSLEFHPCIHAFLYSDELIKELDLKTSHNNYLSWNTPFYNFFTLEGLDSFVKTGQVYGLDEMQHYFTHCQRIQMLKHFLNGNPDFYHPCLLKESFPCNKNFHLEINSNLDIYFVYLDQNNNLYSLILKENSIGYAFKDFFQSMPESDMLYSREEMIGIVRERISWLENGIGF